MAANRYGRIYHSDHHYINLRFPSADARREFAETFEKYHAGHDHDGEAPRFEDTAASTIGNMEANRVHDAHSVSIDGYATYEIEDYHNPSRWNTYNQSRYRPPTCCVAPLISVNRTFVDSSELTRHELSAIFMDMPEEDFQNLLKSVEKDGFKDPVIRMIDEQVLDGWHRYRAAKELNLLRKLRFQQWDEKDEGDPAAFVYARNQNRRHHSKAVRAQIAITFHKRFGHGGDRTEASGQNDDLKTRQEIADEVGVSTKTIDRATQIERAGQAEQVISGEKTAVQVIEEMTIQELYKQINPAISEWKKAREGVGHASKTMLIHASLRWEGLPSDTKTDVKVLKILLNLLTTTETNILEELVRKQLDGKSLWPDPEEELAEKRKLTLEAEHRMFNALDEVAPDWNYDDFIKAACDQHFDWKVIEFPDIDYTDIPDVWEARYNLLHSEITEPAAWIQEMLDKMAEPTKSESEPQETAEERDENTDLKQKKRVIKSLWDKRKQASLDWIGTEDNDLTTYTDLDALEKAFVASEDNSYCADAFQSGMRRTSEQTFNICLEKTLASDVSLEDLEAEYRAVSTYALDILQWERHEWIQQLIAKNKAKADAKAKETEPEPDTEGLSKEFRRIFTLHTRFDRDIVDCEALGETYHLHVNDVESAMDKFRSELATLEYAVCKQIEVDAEMSAEDIASRVEVDDIEVVEAVIAKIQLDADRTDEKSLEERKERLRSDLLNNHWLQHYTWEGLDTAAYIQAYGVDAETLIAIEREISAAHPEPEDMDALWDAFNKRYPKWKAKYAESGYKENDLIQASTEVELFDALRVYRESTRTGLPTAEEIKDVTDLMKSQSYPFTRRVRDVVREKKSKPEVVEVERCYAENSLRVVQNTISPLLERLGADDIAHHDKERLTADLYDVFLQYENVPTEKEMIIALLDVVDSILKHLITRFS